MKISDSSFEFKRKSHLLWKGAQNKDGYRYKAIIATITVVANAQISGNDKTSKSIKVDSTDLEKICSLI